MKDTQTSLVALREPRLPLIVRLERQPITFPRPSMLDLYLGPSSMLETRTQLDYNTFYTLKLDYYPTPTQRDSHRLNYEVLEGLEGLYRKGRRE